MLYRLKSMPGFGETAMLAIDEGGLHADTPEGVSRIKWSAFSSAYRVPNGLLLYRGRIYFNWLPDQAIQGNQDPRQATKLVEKNATKYHDCS
ncbi:unnamed protein product [Ectocarpus sp. 4 AP-2014]